METVQLQCGNCQKLMAISVEHLGSQVHCPHCRAVVQTPPPAAPPPTPAQPAPPPTPTFETRTGDDIFSPPEETGDDLFGGPPQPQVEMPPEVPPGVPAPMFPEAFVPTPPVPPGAPEPVAADPGAAIETVPVPAEDQEDLTQFQRERPSSDKSMLLPMLLIFLVPWGIFWPAVALYFWSQLANRPHPFDTLPDKEPTKGGPREVERVQHDIPLAPHQVTTLGNPVVVGAVEVTPQKVFVNDEGNLVLALNVKNVSPNLAFTPISDKYLEVTSKRNSAKPYTFLESRDFHRLYGGYLEWRKDGKQIDWRQADLRPGEQEQVLLSTMDKDRKTVRKLAASDDKLLWRVQVRRGFVEYRGKQVPATAVIGVRFSPSQIARPGNDA